jgi:hypothetical protein
MASKLPDLIATTWARVRCHSNSLIFKYSSPLLQFPPRLTFPDRVKTVTLGESNPATP